MYNVMIPKVKKWYYGAKVTAGSIFFSLLQFPKLILRQQKSETKITQALIIMVEDLHQITLAASLDVNSLSTMRWEQRDGRGLVVEDIGDWCFAVAG